MRWTVDRLATPEPAGGLASVVCAIGYAGCTTTTSSLPFYVRCKFEGSGDAER